MHSFWYVTPSVPQIGKYSFVQNTCLRQKSLNDDEQDDVDECFGFFLHGQFSHSQSQICSNFGSQRKAQSLLNVFVSMPLLPQTGLYMAGHMHGSGHSPLLTSYKQLFSFDAQYRKHPLEYLRRNKWRVLIMVGFFLKL